MNFTAHDIESYIDLQADLEFRKANGKHSSDESADERKNTSDR